MGFTENQVTFQYKGIVIISRLIEGNFPSFDQVIPKSHDIQLKLKSRQILQATQRAAVGTMDRGGSVRFSFSDTLDICKFPAFSAQGRVEVEPEIEVDYAETLSPLRSIPRIWSMYLSPWKPRKFCWSFPLP